MNDRLIFCFYSSDILIEDFAGSFCISRSDASVNDRLFFFSQARGTVVLHFQK